MALRGVFLAAVLGLVTAQQPSTAATASPANADTTWPSAYPAIGGTDAPTSLSRPVITRVRVPLNPEAVDVGDSDDLQGTLSAINAAVLGVANVPELAAEAAFSIEEASAVNLVEKPTEFYIISLLGLEISALRCGDLDNNECEVAPLARRLAGRRLDAGSITFIAVLSIAQGVDTSSTTPLQDDFANRLREAISISSLRESLEVESVDPPATSIEVAVDLSLPHFTTLGEIHAAQLAIEDMEALQAAVVAALGGDEEMIMGDIAVERFVVATAAPDDTSELEADDDNKAAKGASVGGIFGGIVAALVVVGLIAFVVVRKRQGKGWSPMSQPSAPSPRESSETEPII